MMPSSLGCCNSWRESWIFNEYIFYHFFFFLLICGVHFHPCSNNPSGLVILVPTTNAGTSCGRILIFFSKFTWSGCKSMTVCYSRYAPSFLWIDNSMGSHFLNFLKYLWPVLDFRLSSFPNSATHNFIQFHNLCRLRWSLEQDMMDLNGFWYWNISSIVTCP